VADYLVKGILKRMPDSSVEKHLLIYGCVLHRWETVEQVRTVLFNVDQVRAIMGEGADMKAAMGRLRERSFLDSGHPHMTLRDLLLHDLKQDEPILFAALQCSAAQFFLQAQRWTDAVHHLLSVEDWGTVFQIWHERLDAQDQVATTALLSEITQHSIPSAWAAEAQVTRVKSGLLLKQAKLVMSILELINQAHLFSEHKQAVDSLVEQIQKAQFVPDELKYILSIERATNHQVLADALIGLGAVRRAMTRRRACMNGRRRCASRVRSAVDKPLP